MKYRSQHDANTGEFTAVETYSMLPDDWHEANGGAAIRISQDYSYTPQIVAIIYVVYRISADGQQLTTIQ